MKDAKITLRIDAGLDGYLGAMATVFSALLGRSVSKAEVLIRLAEEGKPQVDAMKSVPSMFDLKNSVSWTNGPDRPKIP